ncbi:FKBP-type peptidyl-prolyl cis-trans isomerase [Halalkalicoccus jeotgali]|uniref:Peptidyl-prolyl cis-trans isomerase n=1 Tax=Halalkalicoccus jeotgali (strain DSM 18796 / CECT 7217 / JCM 14584 / KCTC 4019 / B3) TaxID=795797 RepID=D8J7C3_HALJB|nr:peptidylprolyl isomerase [Halalkalicoccus jeotgali]ADJ14018.1 peptidylprolyl isomerase [Halalkalicoccus jeotgali B3]ELY33936.1 peptidylprolyl isomerase [Halalkalicoccus jeotgali B3]
MGIEPGDQATIEYTGRLADEEGTVFDTSREQVAADSGLAETQPGREYDPLSVELGAGQLIEGFEEGLMGLEEGDTETITVPPEKGYGERRDGQVIEHDRDEFERQLDGQAAEEGMQIQTENGQIGEVIDVGEDVVRIDFNHELAGETLEFDVEVVSID